VKAEVVGIIDSRFRQLPLHLRQRARGRYAVCWFVASQGRDRSLYHDRFGACEVLPANLGKHTTGKACLYGKKLTDVDQEVLEELVVKSLAAMRARYGSCPGCTHPSP
jgi:hypothetical protein